MKFHVRLCWNDAKEHIDVVCDYPHQVSELLNAYSKQDWEKALWVMITPVHEGQKVPGE